jgi:hypothetical protein
MRSSGGMKWVSYVRKRPLAIRSLGECGIGFSDDFRWEIRRIGSL